MDNELKSCSCCCRGKATVTDINITLSKRIEELEKENRDQLIDYENRLCEARKYQQDAVRRCEELEAERDRLREALKEVLNCEVVTDTGDYSKGDTGFDCNEVKEIVFKTLKGKPHDR